MEEKEEDRRTRKRRRTRKNRRRSKQRRKLSGNTTIDLTCTHNRPFRLRAWNAGASS